MISDVIEIKSIPTGQSTDYQFECSGCIDVRAEPVLTVLREVPGNSHVLLDFGAVERVNSMGLSLLLKIFQEWEQNGIRVEVIKLNRMVGMLFKITGLGGYVKASDSAGRSKPLPVPAMQQKSTKRSIWNRLTAGAKNAPTAQEPELARVGFVPRPGTTLHFSANFANNFHRSGWLSFSTFLQQKLQTAIRFEQGRQSSSVGETPVDLLFAGSFEACSMINKRGMIPLMRTDGGAEQVVILAAADDRRQLQDYSEARVATASERNLVQVLGRSLCDNTGLTSSQLEYIYVGNEIRALQMLIKQQVDLVFITKNTYLGLSSFSRDSTWLLKESNVLFSFPLFCIAPQLSGMKQLIIDLLINMKDSEAGQKILNDIQVNGWCQPDPQELKKLTDLFEQYAGSEKTT